MAIDPKNTPSNNEDPLPQIELAGVIVGFLATLKDSPEILRLMGIPRFLAWLFSVRSLEIRCANTILFWTYVVFFAVGVWLLSYKPKIFLRSKNHDSFTVTANKSEEVKDDIVKELNRMKRIRIIRSLGWVFLREFLLDQFNVSIYGTFKRPNPPDWPEEPTKSRYIDRISFTSGEGVEYQYLKNFSRISVRRHPASDDTYGSPNLQKVSFADFKILIVGSNFFPFWLILYILRNFIPQILLALALLGLIFWWTS